jgi:hypothetical protein
LVLPRRLAPDPPLYQFLKKTFGPPMLFSAILHFRCTRGVSALRMLGPEKPAVAPTAALPFPRLGRLWFLGAGFAPNRQSSTDFGCETGRPIRRSDADVEQAGDHRR